MAKKKQKRILHILTREISILDIPRVLDELGYDVFTANLGIRATGFHKEDAQKIVAAIEEYKVQCVTSYDFSESISYACMKTGIPYVSWVYDTPQKELYTDYALFPCNYIFVFDKVQWQRMKAIGIKNVFFMPLAIHGEKIKMELRMSPKKYVCDVAFVGQLYRVNNTEAVVAAAPENIKQEINGCIRRCFMQWNGDIQMHGSMSDKCAAFFDSVEKIPVEKRYPHITKEFYYEAAVLSRMLAHRERVQALNALAQKHDVRFYTFDKDTSELSDKVKVCPGIKHDGGISCVYRDAKINLNITLHCIDTGACQRIFDVMAAGGFMLSNYQKELEELFVPGKEIVMYHNEEEMLQLVEYYLTHEKEREEIARNGQRKVLTYHDFHNRLQKIMEIVDSTEQGRCESYVELQKKELIEMVDERLRTGTQEALRELYEYFHAPAYSLTIETNSSLGCIKEMLYIWNQEKAIGESVLFRQIHSFEEAEKMYLRTKHILWRIENDCEYSACQFGVAELVEKDITCAFMAWQIKANLSERKAVYLKLSEHLWNINQAKGIQMLHYGLFDYPNDADLLMYQANFLLEAQCFMEALDTLKRIPDPDEEICELIQELKTALGVL